MIDAKALRESAESSKGGYLMVIGKDLMLQLLDELELSNLHRNSYKNHFEVMLSDNNQLREERTRLLGVLKALREVHAEELERCGAVNFTEEGKRLAEKLKACADIEPELKDEQDT